jgi:hypothetical protein
MKATIDFDSRLYRRLKVEAARRGRTIRDLVQEGVRLVLGMPERGTREVRAPDEAGWYGNLRPYAANARGKHDMAAIRRSIARKRKRAT